MDEGAERCPAGDNELLAAIARNGPVLLATPTTGPRDRSRCRLACPTRREPSSPAMPPTRNPGGSQGGAGQAGVPARAQRQSTGSDGATGTTNLVLVLDTAVTVKGARASFMNSINWSGSVGRGGGGPQVRGGLTQRADSRASRSHAPTTRSGYSTRSRRTPANPAQWARRVYGPPWA